MIFVMLGTQHQKFDRLINMIINSKKLKNKEIIIQNGHTKVVANNIKAINFCTEEQILKYIQESEFVITHGGVGSIINSLKQNKKVIAIARKEKYKEHADNHQEEICKYFEELGYIENITEAEKLDDVIEKLISAEYKKYVTDTKYLQIVKECIDNI